jgi:hypothetical protein
MGDPTEQWYGTALLDPGDPVDHDIGTEPFEGDVGLD